MSSVDQFTKQMNEFCSRLLSIHDQKLQELKVDSGKSPFKLDDDMAPLIDSTYNIEKHYLCTQIRELRSRISLKSIKNNKVVVESGATEDKIKSMGATTSVLFQELLKQVKKNSVFRVNKMYKSDSIENLKINQNINEPNNSFIIKEMIKTCETSAERLTGFVYLVSALVELDKHYTQNVADCLVFINEKSSEVKKSLEDKVNTLMTLEKGMTSKILSKDRKTIDQRDTFLMSLYELSQ